MADNITIAKDGDKAFHSCLNALKQSVVGGVKDNMWYSSGAPTVDAGSEGTYPVGVGHLSYDYTNSAVYVCTVAPAAATAATFVKMVP